MAAREAPVGVLDLAERERGGDRDLQLARCDEPGSSASTLALAPTALPAALTPYFPTAAKLAIVCLTPHATLPNTGSVLRLSGDFRWQAAGRPAPAEMILSPANRPGLGPADRATELFGRLFRFQRWWEPVPAGLTLSPRAQLVTAPPQPSRFFAVHPGWRYWQPPPAVVH